ncbi:MobC family plasmid mobilization relaxosome protein [Ochrobactrum sp. LMG 5442]|nr:MobC family plasmid mobilization relaxosome protein [Ochrobactrum sp. LMG 5442]
MSALMRETLGLTEAKRRRPMPRVDPALVLELARIGGNLNQVARWLNRAVAADKAQEIDALVVAIRLVSIERALSLLATPRTLACPEANADSSVFNQIGDENSVVDGSSVRS